MPRAPVHMASSAGSDARLLTAARSTQLPWSAPGLDAARQVAESLLGAQLQLAALEPPRLCALRELLLSAPAHAVRFALAAQPAVPGRGPSWLELEPAGAGLWVDRLLGGDGLDAPVPLALPLDAMSHGVLAYLVARALAADGGGLGLEPLDCEPAADQLDKLGVAHAALLVCAGAACRVRLWTELRVGAGSLPEPPPAGAGRAASLELTLLADAGTATLGSTDLGALARGDLVLLDRVDVAQQAGAWSGRVRVHAAQGGAGAILCRVGDDALIVEEFEAFAAFPTSQEPKMTQGRRIPSPEPAPALAALADVPVQLSLELGRFAVTLHELSALRAGDVLVSGLKVGQRVALRAGAQLVASGELVELDGEIAVRIEALAD